MTTIPLIDLRDKTPVDLVRERADHAKELIRASSDSLGLFTRVISALVLPHADRLSRDWLQQTKNPYLQEIDEYAKTLGVTGVHALNVCFEWGCTSGAYQKDQSVALARVLDWVFPKLGENIVVVHQSGPAGDFYNVTWPGVSGIFNAMAVGRFAVALNQAPMRRHNSSFPVDWIKNRLEMKKAAGLPPAHLLRLAFETAKTYDEAKHMLATTEVAIPVIYTLSGTKEGEGCVIERTETDYVIRELEDGHACTANHFLTRLNDIGYGWRPRPVDSFGRLKLACSTPVEAINEELSWFKNPIANTHSRLVMYADAGTGKLSVMGTYGPNRVTEIFKL